MSQYCIKCGRTMDDAQFYKSKNIEKYPPEGLLNVCKKCMTLFVDNWDPETYKPILQEIDVPYIPDEWNNLLEKYGKDASKLTGMTIIGRYLSKMKLKQWRELTWADTERLAEEARNRKITLMKQQGMTGEEIDEQLAIDHTPAKPKGLAVPKADELDMPLPLDDDEQDSSVADSLTEEDKLMLRLKWGRGYRAEEWVRMEQLYQDMMNSYDIQTAGHKDTLIMICKASLKANQCIDGGDIEGFQKMSKVYDQLMKSGKFTAAQNKAEKGEFVDAIGELVALCETDGFIPRYYLGEPNDKVDETIKDMKRYTKTLVEEETNLTSMVEAAIRSNQKEDEEAAKADDLDIDYDFEDDDAVAEIERELRDQDFEDYEDFLDEPRAIDEAMENGTE